MKTKAIEELMFALHYIGSVKDPEDINAEYWKACGMAEAFHALGLITIEDRFAWVEAFASVAEGLEVKDYAFMVC